MTQPEISCSFCHQPKSKVEKLVLGENGVSICNHCVAACYSTLREEGVGVSSSVYSGSTPKAGLDRSITPMTLRYTNTFGDLMAFCFYLYPRSPLVIGCFGIGFILVTLAIIQAVPSDMSLGAKVILLVVMELFVFAFIVGLSALTIVLSMVSRRNKTLLTAHTITLADSSFIEETAYGKGDFKWASVQKLARTKRHIFIYIAQYAAHVVPRRAFRDDTEWNAFFEFCKGRIEAV